MKKEKPQITQMNADKDKENPSATLCANLRHLRFDRLNRESRGFWKGAIDG
jgi:hypothetical protein